jgi:hypothetical protein
VQHHDRRNPEGADNLEHVGTIPASEDSVFMLDDCNVMRIESSGRGDRTADFPTHPLVDDFRESGGLARVENAHDTHHVIRGPERIDKCLTEARETALCGRIGAKNSI